MSATRNAKGGAEVKRVSEADNGTRSWRRWGTYVSERQWGTVREDYSANGDAWNYFPHDHARSRAYRWGEDGLGGFCDERQRLCLGVVLWNGADPILKERLFGLTNREGNHGEDVKEIYYYLDATPTYSYARMLYKYPQATFPYQWLIDENGRRGKLKPEFELIDTGIFNDDAYFDVDIQYAKAEVDDILLQITATNRGRRAARLTVLPQVWFRNTWTWFTDAKKPSLKAAGDDAVAIAHASLGAFTLHLEKTEKLLFCENETNSAALQYWRPRVLQGCLQQFRRARRRQRGESGEDRHQGRRSLRADNSGRGQCRDPAAASPGGRQRQRLRGIRSDPAAAPQRGRFLLRRPAERHFRH